MSVALAVVWSLAAALVLALLAWACSGPLGKMTALWHEVPQDERVRYGLVSPSWWRRLGGGLFTLWMAGGLLTDVWHTQGKDAPGYTFFHSGTAMTVPLLYFVAEAVLRTRWAWRVRQLPEGEGSAPLHQLARWTLPLNAGMCGCLLVAVAAIELFLYTHL